MTIRRSPDLGFGMMGETTVNCLNVTFGLAENHRPCPPRIQGRRPVFRRLRRHLPFRRRRRRAGAPCLSAGLRAAAGVVSAEQFRRAGNRLRHRAEFPGDLGGLARRPGASRTAAFPVGRETPVPYRRPGAAACTVAGIRTVLGRTAGVLAVADAGFPPHRARRGARAAHPDAGRRARLPAAGTGRGGRALPGWFRTRLYADLWQPALFDALVPLARPGAMAATY